MGALRKGASFPGVHIPDAFHSFDYRLCKKIQFEHVQDKHSRRYFKRLPTSFTLDPSEVDRLRTLGGKLLEESPEFLRLLKDLH